MKKKVAIIFGGKSAEHEVSLRSAKNVAAALDLNSYEPLIIGISKQGTWYQFPNTQVFNEITALVDQKVPKQADPVTLICHQGQPRLFSLESKKISVVDIAFPVLHGTFGEDGCIQGHFKMMNLPFVGCGVLGSAIGMDKELMKRLLANAQIPSAPYQVLYSHQKITYSELDKKLGSPFFIKPANAGSSVGVHKIKSEQDFITKIKDAFLYDHKVLAEQAIVGREIECSVMGLNHQPKASVAGEVIPSHEFYSYEAKYLDENGAAIKIPAELNPDVLKKIQEMACRTFQVLNCDGLTRVDFFLKSNNEILINEVNTIPGFTQISMYPKMWEASGLGYSKLVSELIELGFAKYQSDQSLITSYEK